MARLMSGQADQAQLQLVPRIVLGCATGLLLGLLTSLSPVISFAALGAVLVFTVISLSRRADAPRTILMGGTLVGGGAFLLYGFVSTVAACVNTDTFCGNANPWPLGALAVAMIVAGIGAMAIVAIRRPT